MVISIVGMMVWAVMWRHRVMRFRPQYVVRVGALRAVVLLAWALLLVVIAPAMFAKSIVASVDDISLSRAMLAGLEDAVFILPAFLIPRPYRWAFLGFSTALFCRGHAYQGDFAAITKLPFVILSYFLVAEYGVVTTIVAHSINDILVVLAIRALR